LSTIFGFAPTKCKAFKVNKDEITENLELEEIPSKGTSEKRLQDYGITNDSNILIAASMDTDTTLHISLKKTIGNVF
jgi:hypothetical protein